MLPRTVTLGDGSARSIRPLVPSDREALVAGFDSLSPESRIRRFFFEKQTLSEKELHHLTHPDGFNHLAIVLEVAWENSSRAQPIAVARCFRDEHDRSLAEVAFVTRDEWQGHGIGTALVQALAEAAWRVGIRRWFAALFSDHRTTRNLLRRVGRLDQETTVGSGVVEIVCHLYSHDSNGPQTALGESNSGEQLKD
ncbi:MAG: GNAT family N-acetyltransferase [Chthoniobacteraceae bacterium]